MSRSGNRVEPAPGSWGRVSAGQAVPRWWPRSRPDRSAEPGGPDDDGRWGVARLVAQRAAERQASVTPDAGPGADGPADAAAPSAGGVPSPPAPRDPRRAVPPAPRAPLPSPLPVPRPPLPSPRRPHAAVRGGPVVPNASDARAARPRIEPDLSLFGFARHTRGRVGARVFTAFFVVIFALIAVQTIASIV